MNSPSISSAVFENWIELLDARATKNGEEVAFAFLDDEGREADALTYRELDERARALAHQLNCTVSAGDRVLLLHPPGLDYVVSFYACLYAGVIAVPLFPPQRSRIEHIDEVARDCAASVVISTSNVLSGMRETPGDTYLESLPRIASDTEAVDRELISIIQPDTSSIAYLQYTSGSTSAPKGVIITHGMMLQQCAELAHTWGVDAGSVVVSWLPHFHDFGQVSGVLLPVYSGIRAVLMAPATFVKNPIRWLSAVSMYRGTHSGSPNFAFDLCAEKTTPEQRAELDLSSWRMVSNGAEPVRKATLDRFQETFLPCGLPPTAVTPGYGLAEATLKVASGTSQSPYVATRFDNEALGRRKVVPGGMSPATELVACGTATLPTEIAIVTPESGLRVADGEVGEIWASGPIVAPGYWNKQQDSAAVFRARITGADDDRTYLRTGDLGFIHQGELYICGRIKNLMIVNGVNYYLEDLEATVVNCDESLRAGAVLAFSVDRDGQESLVVAAEPRAEDLDPEQLVAVIHDAVARIHGIAPSAIVLIAEGTVPRTTSGKLRRQRCRTDYLAGALSEVYRWEATVPMDSPALETTSAATESGSTGMPSMRELVQQGLLATTRTWIAERAGHATVDESRSLAELGLSSLDQMTLHEHLETWSGKRFPPELMWDAPSITEMTAAIAESITAPAQSVDPAVGAR
ncbi:AMP-binding protein [Nocardia sp. 2]|uniref:AMP-binding protein n=1 Tax=Nocardia acididurans TaxID=2802282 RepID=A0ABS1MDW1_9NOCA|nr:AMP-binding protein [Nocardia acididurans]MBL1078838.1 AMP-binding protein [Nocardia acididurans]